MRIYAAIDAVRTRGDSCGGEVTCVVRGAPIGLGSPVFDKLEAELAKGAMSLPASKVPPAFNVAPAHQTWYIHFVCLPLGILVFSYSPLTYITILVCIGDSLYVHAGLCNWQWL